LTCCWGIVFLYEYWTDAALPRIINATSCQRAQILGSLGIVTALLCAFVPSRHALDIWDAPPFCGVYFGVALCIGIILWGSRRPFDLFAVFLASFLAWIVSYHLAQSLMQSITVALHTIPVVVPDTNGLQNPPVTDDPAASQDADYLLGLIGLFCGLVGSSIVVFGVSIALPSFRTFGNWAKVAMVGTAAGSLLECMEGAHTPLQLVIHIGSVLPVLLAWQIGVLATIAYNLQPQFTAIVPVRGTAAKSAVRVMAPAPTPGPAPARSAPAATLEPALAESLPSQPEPNAPPAEVEALAQPAPSATVAAPAHGAASPQPATGGFGFGIAALVSAILGIFFPFGIILSAIAIVLALVSALMGDKIFAVAVGLIALVNTFVLSPSTWIFLSSVGRGTSTFFEILIFIACLVPVAPIVIRLAQKPSAMS
jgi:hypothetical protein